MIPQLLQHYSNCSSRNNTQFKHHPQQKQQPRRIQREEENGQQEKGISRQQGLESQSQRRLRASTYSTYSSSTDSTGYIKNDSSHTNTIIATAPASVTATTPSTKPTMLEMTEPDQSVYVLTRDQADTFASLLAGFGSGTLSSIACAPLDLIRTRMQVMGDLKQKNNTKNCMVKTSSTRYNVGIVRGLKDIIEAEGIRGCFRGLAPTLMTVPTFWGLYFPLYEVMKKDLSRRGIGRSSDNYDNSNDTEMTKVERVPPLVHMTAAILSGAVADFFCNPMFIVRTRMQTEVLHYMEMPLEDRKPHGIIKTVMRLYREGGLPIFWRGFTASLLGLSHVAIQFPTYEFFKAEARERSETNEESALDLLLASGFSKMVATSLTYPHEVVRSRMMDHRGSSEEQQSLRQTFLRIVRNEGFGALYTGIHVSLVRVVPNCCITFMTYEMILRWTKSKL